MVVRVGSSLFLFAALAAGAEPPIRAYVAAVDSTSVTLAWGTTDGTSRNTIGYAAPGVGTVVVTVGEKRATTEKSWFRFADLRPDTGYSYSIDGERGRIAQGYVRTWAASADSLTFFAIGDFGTGSSRQRELGQKMEEKRRELASAGDPVRFVITTGDNIYGRFNRSGSADRDWESKFFLPYAEVLRSIPFYAVPGNHDGNESERATDLPVYLDNFFFPGGEPKRWYRFEYGGLAEFFALDSTENQYPGPKSPAYSPGGSQSTWLEKELARPALPWRLAVMHHPMFTAGPEHDPSLPQLNHWFQAFQKSGVQAVFSGHEHNFQVSRRNPATGGMQFFVTGAGGQLRPADIRGRMAERQIAAWSPTHHFLVVQIRRDEMRVTPVSLEPVRLRDDQGREAPLPVLVQREKKTVSVSSEQSTLALLQLPGAYDPASINFGLGAILPKEQAFKPLTSTERWRLYRRELLFNPNTILRTSIWAGRDVAGGRPEAWGSGVEGYSQRFASRYGRHFINTTAKHGLAALAGYDLRYVRSTSTNPARRLAHALLWDFITLDRNGHRVLNWPRLTALYGSEMAAATWTPSQKWSAQGIQNANEQFAFGWVMDVAREFYPDLKSLVSRKRKNPNGVPSRTFP